VEEGKANGLPKQPAPHRPRAATGAIIQQRKRPGGGEVNDKLYNLRLGNVPLPPTGNTKRRRRVVAVHGNVYERVGDDEHPRDDHAGLVVRPEKDEHHTMVVDV